MEAQIIGQKEMRFLQGDAKEALKEKFLQQTDPMEFALEVADDDGMRNWRSEPVELADSVPLTLQ